MTNRPALLAEISESLFTGGYDGMEGEEGSSDTTWTDFGIVCGIGARYEKALRDIASAAGYPDAAQACRNVIAITKEAFE